MHNCHFMNHLVSLLVCIFSHYIRTYLLLLYASFLYGLKSKQLFGVFVRNIASFQNTSLWWFSQKDLSSTLQLCLSNVSLFSARGWWSTLLIGKSHSDLILKVTLTSWLEAKLKEIWHVLYIISSISPKWSNSTSIVFNSYRVACKSAIFKDDFWEPMVQGRPLMLECNDFLQVHSFSCFPHCSLFQLLVAGIIRTGICWSRLHLSNLLCFLSKKSTLSSFCLSVLIFWYILR